MTWEWLTFDLVAWGLAVGVVLSGAFAWLYARLRGLLQRSAEARWLAFILGAGIQSLAVIYFSRTDMPFGFALHLVPMGLWAMIGMALVERRQIKPPGERTRWLV